MNPNQDSNAAPEAPVTQVIPEVSATPVTPEVAVASGAPAPKPKNKKVILIASIIGGVVLLAGIAVALFLLMTTVSKKDYADAASQYNTVSSAYSSLQSDRSLSGSALNDDEFESKIAGIGEKIDTLKSENESLGKLKAVKVGEGKELYAEFDSKLTGYAAYSEELLASIKEVKPAFSKCQSMSSIRDAAAYSVALKECSTSLNTVGDIPSEDFKTYIDATKTKYAELATVYEGISKITDRRSQSAEYTQLLNKSREISKEITAASQALNAGLKEKTDEFNPKEAADALRAYLNEQQRN